MSREKALMAPPASSAPGARRPQAAVGGRPPFPAGRRPASGSRSGAVLVLALVMLAVVSLTGVTLLVGAQTQMADTGRAVRSGEAFATADSAAMTALMLTRLLANYGGVPPEILAGEGSPAMVITLDAERFNNESLGPDPDRFDFEGRYLETVDRDGPGPGPHIIFKVGEAVVATASVRQENDLPLGAGFSLAAGDYYDAANGQGFELNLVVTVVGGPPDPGRARPDEARTVVTAVWREYVF